MQVKLGLVVTELSGSAGGHTIQRTKDGFTMKPKTDPKKSPTRKQSTKRFQIQIVSQRWRELAQSVRKNWLNTSWDGVSGFELYRQVNLRRLTMTQQLVIGVPARTPADNMSGFLVESDASIPFLRIRIPVAGTLNTILMIECTPPLSPGITNPNSYFKLLMPAAMNGITVANFLGNYVSAYGTLRAGDTIFVRCSFWHRFSTLRSNYAIRKATVLP